MDYQSYQDLPPLAGVCTFDAAMRPGLSIDDCVARLKRYHYVLKRMHGVFLARLTAEPIYELKMAFSYHAYLCAEHVVALRKRVGEMREPPLGLDRVPSAELEILLDEVLAAPTTAELLVGIYEVVLPALLSALERHQVETNPLADHASARLCRVACFEFADVLDYGTQAVARLVDAPAREGMSAWRGLLADCLAVAGGVDGGADPATGRTLARQHSARPFIYDGRPRRDERFPDPYNMGVNAEVFLYDKDFPVEPKTLMMFYKRLREIDVPEMMASILTETKGKPWTYYLDMTRQLWDEARHAMMGEVGFVNLGIDWRGRVLVNFTWSLALNTQLSARERHAVLYYIEQGLMPKTGKRFEWEVGVASMNPLSAVFQDYDWADEVLHAKIGRDWYVSEFKNPAEATAYGDDCWSRVLVDWNAYRAGGLTDHRNWWPDLYREACHRWGTEPDSTVLAFAVTYEKTRADLKEISAPA